MFEYWHERKELTDDIKSSIGSLVDKSFKVLDNLYSISGKSFRQIFELNRKYLFHGDCTAPASENDYSLNRNYVTEDGLSGFSITRDNWIISVFSNNRDNKLFDLLCNFLEYGTKVVVVTSKHWTNSVTVKRYIDLGFSPLASTLDDTDDMVKTYGFDYMNKFMSFYGETPIHVVLGIVDKGLYKLKYFDNCVDAIEYVNILTLEGK